MNFVKLKFIYVVLVSLLIMACGGNEEKEKATSSRNSLDWLGFYQGVLKETNEGNEREIFVDIELKSDSTFIKREKILKTDDKLMTINGRFVWSEDGNSIILQSDYEAYDSILSVEEERLVFRKKLAKDIATDKRANYILTKIPGILLEREWKIIKLNDTFVNIVAQGDNDHLNIYFASDENKAYGFGGCNFYRSSYYLVGNELSFTPVMSTKMAGPNIKTENKFFNSLRKVKQYEIIEDELYLQDDKGINIITAKVRKK